LPILKEKKIKYYFFFYFFLLYIKLNIIIIIIIIIIIFFFFFVLILFIFIYKANYLEIGRYLTDLIRQYNERLTLFINEKYNDSEVKNNATINK